jgi:hypothetical protein
LPFLDNFIDWAVMRVILSQLSWIFVKSFVERLMVEASIFNKQAWVSINKLASIVLRPIPFAFKIFINTVLARYSHPTQILDH